ncbi:MAG: hypothetical protein CL669_05655 [Balneola sp.]|nr:hypothetical protein [Balneola sp.]|tara:strand:- start:7172 stop:9166 length:1995 start_codon:yes stop_codon:yes gene_type:complete
MPGGLLNLIAYGNQNIVLNGNPTCSFFKGTYKKYTNFGLQKFRVDFDGQRVLKYNEESVFSFKMPRYADLILDTCVVVTLPNIWSPIVPPQDCSGTWLPYEFKWIENLGFQMIKEITVNVGGQTLQKFSGQYLINQAKRDWDTSKKKLLDEMIGNVTELNDPANYSNNNGYYPSAYYTNNSGGAEPSIRGRHLYIPLDCWFTLNSRMAFPLVALQYNELTINVTFRPVREICQIRDANKENTSPIASSGDGYVSRFDTSGPKIYTKYYGLPIGDIPYVAPNPNDPWQHFYRFLQTPPTADITPNDYKDKGITKNEWNADVHLISTYAFLSDEESRLFAANSQKYLIKEIYEYKFHRATGSTKVSLDSLGMVSDWMLYFQRSDVNLRNEWSNYSNWEYKWKPRPIFSVIYNIDDYPLGGQPDKPAYGYTVNSAVPGSINSNSVLNLRDTYVNLPNWHNWISNIDWTSDMFPNASPSAKLLPGVNNVCNQPPHGSVWMIGGSNGMPYQYPPIKITGNYAPENQKDILLNLAVLLDGKYRENLLETGVYNYMEKYTRSNSGSDSNGLYCYNFCLDSSYLHPNVKLIQPTGAINLSKFSTIELEFSTYVPPLDNEAQTAVICDACGNIIGINKSEWEIYKYTYDLNVIEGRYNTVTFVAGNCSLQYAR